ncbi:unnamed protein product [Durusdinium trenchii]|uniref:Dynein attachment factor N-terminal domain-containing protein n=1 Tax=Durusdinium trenchii TaxID=1381693 RepID=A0ABP0P3S3_9DINO
MVYVELQYLGAYLLETERHGFSLEEVFEIVQYEGNCLPRLYLLVTVGMASEPHRKRKDRILTLARMLATSESDEILQDLDRMVRAVQHPVRGLFLRYFLLQVVKDKLQGLRSGMMGALTFLLGTFKEVVILWQRLRLEAWELDEYRFSLRLLLGAHLMEISRLEGLTTQLYAEVVLPELLNLVPACEDAAGQDTIDDAKKRAITTTASYDEFKSRVAGCMLKPIHKNEFNERAELVVHMNSEAVQRIFGREMDAEVFQKLLEALEQVHAAHVPAGTARRFLTDMATCCPSSTSQATAFYSAEERKLLTRLLARDKVFGDAFHLHTLEKVLATCEEVKGKSALDVSLRLIASLLENECTESCMELLRSTVQLLEAPGVPCPLETKLAQAVVDLMAAPLTQESLASVVLAMPYHKSLLAMMSQSMQARGALAMVSALLAGDVRLQDSETVQNLFLLTGPLLRDKTGKDDPGEDLMRHLEHDPLVFRTEQETMAQLIHQVRQDDPKVVFEMLSILWKHFEQGGPHRIVFTVPAMVAAVLELARRAGGHAERWPVKIFDFTHTLCSSLGTLAPRESLRLWLLCSACADNAAAAEKQEATRTELVQRISSSMDNALLCLERNISEQEARLRGLQLLVGTLRQMRQGMEATSLWSIPSGEASEGTPMEGPLIFS